jgi:hypothetical protein
LTQSYSNHSTPSTNSSVFVISNSHTKQHSSRNIPSISTAKLRQHRRPAISVLLTLKSTQPFEDTTTIEIIKFPVELKYFDKTKARSMELNCNLRRECEQIAALIVWRVLPSFASMFNYTYEYIQILHSAIGLRPLANV